MEDREDSVNNLQESLPVSSLCTESVLSIGEWHEERGWTRGDAEMVHNTQWNKMKETIQGMQVEIVLQKQKTKQNNLDKNGN